MDINNLKIDLVYLWVDDSDINWRKQKEAYAKRTCNINDLSTNSCRFKDNQELKFSLRSVMMNIPWINNIFIVTCGQVPSWLDLKNNSKINIITHEQIMPKEALPTFNSEAIETCICNIPSLSEYFLYANDDFFVNKPLKKDFFFDKNGNPITRMKQQFWTNEEIEKRLYQHNVTYSYNLLKTKFNINEKFNYESMHNIDAYRKSYYLECKNLFKEEFEKTCYSKFRTKDSVQRTIVQYYMIIQNKCKPIFGYSKINNTIYVGLTYKDKMAAIIKEKQPDLLCINDSEYTAEEHRINLKSFLSSLYPSKQAWEKEEDFQIKRNFNDIQNTIPIIFCPDNNYCKYFAVTLQSLIDNSSTNKYYDIIILNTNINPRYKDMLYSMLPKNFSLRFYDIDYFINENFNNLVLKPKNNWSVAMYYRMFIPLIMQKYDKVLYLDSDIVCNKKIDKLFNIDSENSYALVVRDTISAVLDYPKNKVRLFYMKNELKLSNSYNYFNSGMIMFNIKNINIDTYISDFKKSLKTLNLLFPDQDLLNIILENKIKIIHSKYNYLTGEIAWNKNYINLLSGEYYTEFVEAMNAQIIIHYTSPMKPWNTPSQDYAHVFWHYARKTPFYEEILYTNILDKSNKKFRNSIKNINLKKKLYFNYYRCKILSFITNGKIQNHYKQKTKFLKQKVREIRDLSK